MKILLVSDSHGDHEVLEKLYRQYPKMDLYLHAGDSQENPYSLVPFISIKGNCDYDNNFLANLKLNTPYGYLYIQHLPYFQEEILNDESIKIIIYGHTHKKDFRKVNNRYYINPGSTTLPRDQEKGSYCILKIDALGVDATFFDI